MGKLNYICLGLCLANSVLAQSAANFDTKVMNPTQSSPKETKGVKSTTDQAVAVESSIPSRYVGEAELESYLASRSSILIAGNRDKDPFGHYQDPDAKPIVKPTAAKVATRSAPARATPLEEIVKLLSITTIMPGEKSFLVGTRKVSKGDELPLIFRGKQLRVKVTEVTSHLISFANIESGETGTRTLDMLPPGMRVGNGSEEIKAPGMIHDRPDAPIELEMGDNTP